MTGTVDQTPLEMPAHLALEATLQVAESDCQETIIVQEVQPITIL